MRILYINRGFSGAMEVVARHMAQNRAHNSVFLAERWPRGAKVPGIMLMRIAPHGGPAEGKVAPQEKTLEHLALRHAQNTQKVLNACVRLRKSGFLPDAVYATALDGYAQNVMEVFPAARLVLRLDWCSVPEGSLWDSPADSYQRAQASMCNAMQGALLSQCRVGLVSSEVHKTLFGAGHAAKLRLLRNGVDTQFFTPSTTPRTREVVTFACQGGAPVQQMQTIIRCLPALLALRPHCQVCIISFPVRRSDASRAQCVRELTALLHPLTESQRQRVSIEAAPPPARYVALLQQSRLYVYLTSGFLLTAGLMEAMSCGTPVLASATEPVQELVSHGKNGLLWQNGEVQELAFDIAQACQREPVLTALGGRARETILARHDIRKILPLHASVILGRGR